MKEAYPMALFVLSYDQSSTYHDYSNLFALLTSWRAAHLQNSVWLVDMNGNAETVRDAMRAHMHTDDTVAVIQLPGPGFGSWAAVQCRPEGITWLRAHIA
jgi:hypothetical protein